MQQSQEMQAVHQQLQETLQTLHRKAVDADQILDEWIESNQVLLKRWYHMMSEFKTSTTHEFAKFSVALRELMLLSVKSNH